SAQLLRAQKRFFRCLRQLAAHWPAGPDCEARRLALQDRNERLAATFGIEKVVGQAKAEEFIPDAADEPTMDPRSRRSPGNAAEWISLPLEGTPVYWFASEGEPAPDLHLIAVEADHARATWIRSCALVFLLAAAAVIASLPR